MRWRSGETHLNRDGALYDSCAIICNGKLKLAQGVHDLIVYTPQVQRGTVFVVHGHYGRSLFWCQAVDCVVVNCAKNDWRI